MGRVPDRRRHARSTGGGPVTDYNDGKWHGCNGGECPVHPESIVDLLYADPEHAVLSIEAGDYHWDSDLVAFRVIKQHREPRELWMHDDGMGFWCECSPDSNGATLFREVLE